MKFPTETNFRIWNGIEWIGEVAPGHAPNPNDYDSFDDLIFQQSSGYFDRLGTEMYEGDIVKINPESFMVKVFGVGEYTAGEIVIMNAAFNICQKNLGRTLLEDFITCHCHPTDLEIIGNIYENSELKQI